MRTLLVVEALGVPINGAHSKGSNWLIPSFFDCLLAFFFALPPHIMHDLTNHLSPSSRFDPNRDTILEDT